MIIVDTNVVSEAIRPTADTRVVHWFRKQPITRVYVTSVTKAELLYGLALLSDGIRKQSLAAAIGRFFDEQLATSILPFAENDAVHYARISAQRRRSGRPIRELDGQIAAIARSHRFAVATRNIRDFEDCGIAIVNPWDAPA